MIFDGALWPTISGYFHWIDIEPLHLRGWIAFILVPYLCAVAFVLTRRRGERIPFSQKSRLRCYLWVAAVGFAIGAVVGFRALDDAWPESATSYDSMAGVSLDLLALFTFSFPFPCPMTALLNLLVNFVIASEIYYRFDRRIATRKHPGQPGC